jgi:hypothetical protein
LKLVYDLIEMRRKDAEKEFETAVTEKRWSNVSGWHGISTGLMMAQKVIQEEMNYE